MNSFQIETSKAMDALRDLPLAIVGLAVMSCTVLFVFARSLIKAYKTPLSDIPGPWIAKFTRFWLLWGISTRSWQKINVELHREYGMCRTPEIASKNLLTPGVGPIVRISPNEYSLDDPNASKIIYRTRDELVKVILPTPPGRLQCRLRIPG